MVNPPPIIENWRDFFRLLDLAGLDPWTVCEHALAVSYLEDPIGFVSNRDALAQKLFAPEKLDFAHKFPANVVIRFDSNVCRPDTSSAYKSKSIVETYSSRSHSELDCNCNGIRDNLSCEGDSLRLHCECSDSIGEKLGDTKKQFGQEEDEEDNVENEDKDRNVVRSLSFGLDEAEALTRELEDEMLYKQEVLSIKRSLEEKSYQSEREIYDSLQRLELMDLSFDLLKETEIGKAVNGLRKSSPSTRVASLAKRLVRGWKELVHACCKSAIAVSAAATTKETIDYGTPCFSMLSVFDEEPGLPSPPMDEAALLGVSTASVDMFQLWDLMEDVTSLDAVKESDKKHENFQKENESHPHIGTTNTFMERKMAKQVSDVITRTNTRREEISGIHPLSRPQQKYQQKGENFVTRHQESIDERMESAKRNLRVNYEREQNAKKQRTIQVLDLHDLPKGGPARAKFPHLMHGRPSSQNRPRALICR